MDASSLGATEGSTWVSVTARPIANRSAVLASGTTLVTFLWDLNIAVIAFTGVFFLTNKVLRPHNPIRDLKPDERLVHED